MAALAGDRNAEVRRAACQALQVVYTHMDGPTLLAHIAQARPPDQVHTLSLQCLQTSVTCLWQCTMAVATVVSQLGQT